MDLIWVIDAKYVSGFRIKLKFNDGVEGVIDLSESFKGVVFEPLKDEKYFRRFKLNSWTIEWENGADFAPEFLYERVNESLITV